MTDSSNDQPNMDLISMVQRVRMQHDSEAAPSEVSAVYWIEAKCQGADCQSPTAHTGAWVLDTTVADVDALWETVKAATESGKLGYKSKVSTAPRASSSRDSRTIMVLTYNSRDPDDVQRVRDALKHAGVDGDWRYEGDDR